MSRWHDDKGKVKDVFDCIRNYLICGAVFFAGIHAIFRTSGKPIIEWLNLATGITFVLISVYLFFVNTLFLNKSVLAITKHSGIKFFIVNVVASLFVLLGTALMTQSAMDMRFDDKNRLGELTFKQLKQNN
jgi:hypothetical protein